jgi:hypothetical protein
MSTHAAPKKTYELLAILCLLPALYIQVKWMQVFYGGGNMSPSARTSTFLEEFPSLIASTRIIAFLSLAFAVVAIVLAQRSFNQPKMVWRISSFVVVLIAALIVLMSLFQMM